MAHMDNEQSSTLHEGPPSPQQGYRSSIATGGNFQGNFSGNHGSYNNFGSNITQNYHYGAPNPSQTQAEILQCLYTSKYEEHRERVHEPVEGTCTWVTHHPKYRDWLESKTSGILWLSADPGCGKSVIASFLVDRLRTRAATTVCYFFFKDDNDEQKSATSALCAILHQIFRGRPHLTEFAEEEFKAKGKVFTGEVNALWGILVKAVAGGGCGNVICVVDALDECEERTLDQFIRRATGLSGSHTPESPLRFLFTGRPYHKVERGFAPPATTIRLRGEEEIDSIATDVTRVIDQGVKSLESYWGQHGKLGYLRDLLESSADRTFLWVALILEILKGYDDDSEEEFTKIVNTMPANLEELYRKILDKSGSPDKTRRILSIVATAARPLTLREMNAALRIKREHRSSEELGDMPVEFKKIVKNWCGLFVRVIDSKIYLVHQTAREFLVKGSSGHGNWQYTLSPVDYNFLLADICISYLSLEDFGNDPLVVHPQDYDRRGKFDSGVEKYSLLDYAASHWADHFRDSRARQMELFEFTRLICGRGSKRFLTWWKVYWRNNGFRTLFPTDFTYLMIATWLGQGTVVERLLQEGGDTNARAEEYGTAVNIAAIREDENMARMLLRSKVKAYIGGRECDISKMRGAELISGATQEEDQPLFCGKAIADLWLAEGCSVMRQVNRIIHNSSTTQFLTSGWLRVVGDQPWFSHESIADIMPFGSLSCSFVTLSFPSLPLPLIQSVPHNHLANQATREPPLFNIPAAIADDY
ncbi:NACHT-ANK domain protein transcript variant 3 [Tuber magnatum]|uniref:NACHT-ANK domain protein transcript variant 3 n=1 Tax=Tuber magnatum TaxID=42249 RepID=A0A317SI25_9PEZI|nr:NACHT-ANK domain protein transcript variant 3 [Tuber magnatum]